MSENAATSTSLLENFTARIESILARLDEKTSSIQSSVQKIERAQDDTERRLRTIEATPVVTKDDYQRLADRLDTQGLRHDNDIKALGARHDSEIKALNVEASSTKTRLMIIWVAICGTAALLGGEMLSLIKAGTAVAK